MTFEQLFNIGAGFRVVLGVIFALFLICFAVIIVEEVFFGGRRRRKALKAARERMMADPATTDPAP
jgi:hypothetical protein